MKLLPNTAGFVPLHLYEGMELERSTDIVSEINSMALAQMGFGEAKIDLLLTLSLREMLDAVALVERYNDRPRVSGVSMDSYMVPDDRLTAAAYTLLHSTVRNVMDDDETLVTFKRKRWGQDEVHFLGVGARCGSELEDQESNAA